MVLHVLSGQHWRNVIDGRSPLKNFSPANVSKYFNACILTLLTCAAHTGAQTCVL